MSRARFASRNARSNGSINKGVGHKIKKPSAKKKSSNKYTTIRPFGEFPQSPKVKPADRVSSATTSPASSETGPDTGKRFFRSRDLNRKATVVMSKELKYQVTSGGLVRSPAPTRRGPYKNVKLPPARPRPAASAACSADGPQTEEQRQLLAAIDSLDGVEPASPRPSTPTTPATPATPAGSLRLELAESDDDVPALRRSPRKRQTPTSTPSGQRQTQTATPSGQRQLQRGTATPSGQQQQQQRGTPTTGGQPGQTSSGVTPVRRSPRKQSRPLPQLPAAGTPTHAENEGPTRLTLTPRRSPRKHQLAARTPQAVLAGGSPSQATPDAIFDRLEEQLMKMEAGEDKENESPQRRKKDEQSKFYSIFYRRPDGSSGSRGAAAAPPPASTSAANKNVRVPPRSADDGLEQLVIDAGQRQFGVITCSTCTLVYTIGDPEDEAMHARHHTGYLGALNYPGWKKEHEVGQCADGRVLMVTPKDPPHAWRKVDSVLRIVDAELGFVGVGVRNKEESKVFFYVVGRQIVGCLVAEPVNRGFPVLPIEDTGGARSGVRCSTKSKPCVVGVSRVWVHHDYRRKRLASRMVDAMKSHFSVTPLRWQDVAFSDPTPDGLEFAAGVTGSLEFLVYNK